MKKVILDASALLAMLKEEAGGANVADVIDGALMTAVNYAEVVSHFIHMAMPADQVDAMLGPLPFVVVSADTELARIAGQLRSLTAEAGLSLGDRFCLALALRDNLVAWTADKQWLGVAERIGARIEIIR